MNALTPFPIPDLAEAARESVERIIARGARDLIADPWRAERINRGADAMTVREIELACNRMLPAARDMNRAIALLQLRRATDQPEFVAAWDAYRAGLEPVQLAAAE